MAVVINGRVVETVRLPEKEPGREDYKVLVQPAPEAEGQSVEAVFIGWLSWKPVEAGQDKRAWFWYPRSNNVAEKVWHGPKEGRALALAELFAAWAGPAQQEVAGRPGTCPACGQAVMYRHNAAGKQVPVETKPGLLLLEDGHLVRGYTPHSAACKGKGNG